MSKGDIVLTVEEATRIHYLVSGLRSTVKYEGHAMLEANCDEIIDILGHKLSFASAEKCEHDYVRSPTKIGIEYGYQLVCALCGGDGLMNDGPSKIQEKCPSCSGTGKVKG